MHIFILKLQWLNPFITIWKSFIHIVGWPVSILCLTMLDFLSFPACSRILLVILWLFPLSMFHCNLLQDIVWIDFISVFSMGSLHRNQLSIYLMNWLIGFYMVKSLHVQSPQLRRDFQCTVIPLMQTLSNNFR